MKKQITSKLQLSKETLRHLSERDLQGAVGGYSWACVPTTVSDCLPCPSEACTTFRCASATCESTLACG
jgi:hypothetical protein